MKMVKSTTFQVDDNLWRRFNAKVALEGNKNHLVAKKLITQFVTGEVDIDGMHVALPTGKASVQGLHIEDALWVKLGIKIHDLRLEGKKVSKRIVLSSLLSLYLQGGA